jgi:predicted RNase H-like nuclease (RuvC/YqgF family)
MVDNSKYHLDRIEAMETEINRLNSVISEQKKKISNLKKKNNEKNH